MPRSPYEHDHLDDDDSVLPDGGTVRVPMMLRDGTTVQLEPWQCDVVYAHRLGLDDGLALHKPGQRFCVDAAARARVEQARAEWIDEMTTAWQRQPIADASGGGRDQQPGDQCTKDSASARPVYAAVEGQRVKDEAWLQMCRELEGEWRKPLP
jgi:hypothetical protein